MALRLRDQMTPFLFAEGLVPGSLIPACIGRHLNFVTTAVGPVSHTQKIVIAVKQAGHRDRARDIYWFLLRCKYTNVVCVESVEMLHRDQFGNGGSWAIVGGTYDKV